jgi:hypothetical protein
MDAELTAIQREIDYYANTNTFDKETDTYNRIVFEKYKTINLYLFYFFYLLGFGLIGWWTYKNYTTLSTLPGILRLVGMSIAILSYPFWIHVLVSWVRPVFAFPWQLVKSGMS